MIPVRCWVVYRGRRTDDTFLGLINPADPVETTDYLRGRLRLAIRSHGGVTPEQGARDYALDVDDHIHPTWTVRLDVPEQRSESA